MKNFELNLKIEEIRKIGETVQRVYNAELILTDDTNFSDIVKFIEDIKKIWKKGMAAIKSGYWMELEVIESTYDNWLDTEKELVTKTFNRWVSIPVDEQDGEGIYLRADTRYSDDEYRDMYLTKDILKDLTFTLR